ncbi:MAG: VWA domain-containing protein [Candidatus Acidiferrales bacterium]
MKFGLVIRFVILLAWIPVALAQTSTPLTSPVTSPDTSPNPVLSARSNLVLVPALVRRKSGELVFTLTAKDFAITDDGVEEKVALEENTDGEPLALVILVETGGTGARQLEKYIHLATTIEAVVGNVPHRIAVVGFDSVPTLLQDFTSDIDVVDGAIRGLSAGNGGAAILDGLGFSIDLLRKQPPEYRRAILLLSETVDHGSHMKLDEAVREISDTNTAIYSLGFSSSKSEIKGEASKLNNNEPGPPGGCMSKDPNADSDTSRAAQTWECLSELAPPLRAAKMAVLLTMNGLRRNVPESVAHLTGGEYFRFSKARSLESSLLTISNHVPNRYVLSFQPQSPHPGMHVIELRLKEHRNLIVTARRNYWADSESTGDPAPEPHP